MKKIFWGLILTFIDINLSGINIFPEFVGYLLIFFGMRELSVSRTMEKGWTLLASTAVAFVTWLPFELSGGLGDAIETLLSCAQLVTQIWVSWMVVLAVKELEEKSGIALNSAVLQKRWKLVTILAVVSLVVAILTAVLEVEALALVAVGATAVCVIAAIIFIIDFHKSRKLMEAHKQA